MIFCSRVGVGVYGSSLILVNHLPMDKKHIWIRLIYRNLLKKAQTGSTDWSEPSSCNQMQISFGCYFFKLGQIGKIVPVYTNTMSRISPEETEILQDYQWSKCKL